MELLEAAELHFHDVIQDIHLGILVGFYGASDGDTAVAGTDPVVFVKFAKTVQIVHRIRF